MPSKPFRRRDNRAGNCLRPFHLSCLLALLCAPASAAGAHHSVPGPKFLGESEALAAAKLVSAFGQVTSVFRTVAHNREVGGVPDSYHLLGRAIDVVRRRGVTHAEITAALRAAGFHLIESLDEGTHSHFAFGAVQPRIAVVHIKASDPKPDPLLADRHGVLMVDRGQIGERRPFGGARSGHALGR